MERIERTPHSKITYSAVATFLFVIMTVTDLAFGESVQLYKIPKYLMLAFFVIMFLWLLVGNKGQRTVPVAVSLCVPLVFTFYEFASCLWAVHPSVAFSQMVTQVQLTILYIFVYLLFRKEDHLDDYLRAIYLSGFLMGAYLLYTYGLNGIVSQMLSGIRVGGQVGNENSVGMVCARSALIAFCYLITKRNPKYLISIAIMTFFAFSSGSRKAILIILVGVIALVALNYGVKRLGKTLVWLILIAVAVYLVMKLPFMSTAAQRLTDMLHGEQDASAIERSRLIRIGWEGIKEKFIFGYGLSNFSAIYPGTGYSHNNYIEILFSLGIVGALLYYSMHIRAGIWTTKLLMRGADWRYVVLLIMLLINVVFGWGMVQFYGRESWVFLAVILAASERKQRQLGGDNNGNHL